MRKSLLFAALIAALAVVVFCGGTLANPQEDAAVAQTSGDVGQFKGQCRTAGTSSMIP
jgi:ABC-type glycerol-3-phosphate transport system substrate-binding protein